MGELAKFEGDVYVGRIDPVTGFLGYNGPFECDSFKPSRDGGSTTEVKSKRRGIYNQVINSEVEAATPKLEMVFLDVTSELLALMYAAAITTGNVTGGSATNEVVTATAFGTKLKLAHTGVSAVVVKDVTNATTYVLNTDYTTSADDLRLGMFEVVSGGGIDVGDVLHVSYTYATVTADAFNGETIPSTDVMVFFDGKNRISGKDFSTEYYQVTIPAPTDMMDLLSSDLVNVTLVGTAITPAGKPAPYRVLKGK